MTQLEAHWPADPEIQTQIPASEIFYDPKGIIYWRGKLDQENSAFWERG